MSEYLAAARKLGAEHGRNAGSWVIDGNTSQETVRWIVRAMNAGDPALYDQLPGSPLSGEWADGWTPQDVAREVGLGPDDDAVEEACNAYEEAWQLAMEEEVERSALAVLTTDEGDQDWSDRGIFE